MNFLFAWRYFKSKKTTNVINVISWISVLAIAVGTAALIIILSVFNGFESLVHSLYNDFYPDIRIEATNGKFVQFTPNQIEKISKTSGVADYSMLVEEKAVLVNGDYNTIIHLKGVDQNYSNVVNLKKHLITGKYELGTSEDPKIILGAGLDNAIGYNDQLPSPLTVYLPNSTAKDFSNLQDALYSYNVRHSGTFRIQEDFDDKYGFTNISFMQYMMNLPQDMYSGVEIHRKAGFSPHQVKLNLQSLLGSKYKVLTRYEQNQGLFSVMQMEKWIIYAILSLILIISSFNMIGALTMLVLEKQKDIAVLKAMGADRSTIQRIFINEGLLLGILGGIIGVVIALAVCIAQAKWHLIKLAGGTFLIDYYPVKMRISDFILVAFTIIVVALLSAWIPAKKAAGQEFSLKS